MRIYYDKETDVFLKIKSRKEPFETMIFDAELNVTLHTFFSEVEKCLDGMPYAIKKDEFEVTFKRTTYSGTVEAYCTPYTVCMAYCNSPMMFVSNFI